MIIILTTVVLIVIIILIYYIYGKYKQKIPFTYIPNSLRVMNNFKGDDIQYKFPDKIKTLSIWFQYNDNIDLESYIFSNFKVKTSPYFIIEIQYRRLLVNYFITKQQKISIALTNSGDLINFTIVQEENSASYYVNGIYIDNDNDETQIIPVNQEGFQFGYSQYWNNIFQGLISSVILSSSRLNAKQVLDYYNTNLNTMDRLFKKASN